MSSKKHSIFSLITALIFVFILSACATNAADPAPSAEPTEKPAVVEPSAGTSLENGEVVFNGLCFACHGADGTGVEGLGKDLHTSEFVLGATNAELAAFIAVGRAVDDPANTTGVAMPASGGNPNLTEADLDSVVLYIRELAGK